MKRLILLLMLCIFSLPLWGDLPYEIHSYLEPILFDNVEDRDIVEELLATGKVEREGEDRLFRPSFVTLQALMEKSLADLLGSSQIVSCTCAIHTPMPPTPLCLSKEFSPTLTTEEMSQDQKRIQTVIMRNETLKALLRAGAKLLCVYPSENYHKRTPEERAAYEEHLVRYESWLYNCPIKESLPDALIGATYYFVDKNGEAFCFSIQSTQANDARDAMRWALYLDSIKAKGVDKRFARINAFIKSTTGFSLELLGKKT